MMKAKRFLFCFMLFAAIFCVFVSQKKQNFSTVNRFDAKSTATKTEKAIISNRNKTTQKAANIIENVRKNVKNDTSNQKESKTDAVILLTTMRSGSSIVGSIFDERPNVTYLYEPLFPFGDQACNDKTKNSTIALLRHASTCHFEYFRALYQPTNRFDKWSRCKIHHLCFVGMIGSEQKHSKFISRDADICRMNGSLQECPAPINPVHLNKHCQSSLLVAMKVIYLCKLEWLRPLLADPDVNIKVVHLVRDPRSTINSRAQHSGDIKKIEKQVNEVCNRLQTDLIFAETFLKFSPFRHKYMRIRYEDFVLNPLGNALKIYDFIGINMTLGVKEWLDEATCVSKNSKAAAAGDDQSMKRNVKTVLHAWRKELSFDGVKLIQDRCDKILHMLNYTKFDNEKELHNLSKPYFVPNWH